MDLNAALMNCLRVLDRSASEKVVTLKKMDHVDFLECIDQTFLVFHTKIH